MLWDTYNTCTCTLFISTVEYFPPCLTTVDGRSYEFYVGRDIFLQAVIIDASGSLLSLTPLVTAVGIVLAFVLQGEAFFKV